MNENASPGRTAAQCPTERMNTGEAVALLKLLALAEGDVAAGRLAPAEGLAERIRCHRRA